MSKKLKKIPAHYEVTSLSGTTRTGNDSHAVFTLYPNNGTKPVLSFIAKDNALTEATSKEMPILNRQACEIYAPKDPAALFTEKEKRELCAEISGYDIEDTTDEDVEIFDAYARAIINKIFNLPTGQGAN